MQIRVLSLALLLIAGCGGTPPDPVELERQAFDDLRDEVRLVVQDSGRETAVLGIVDELQADFIRLRELAEGRRQGLRELNADYDATRAQFETLLSEFSQQREFSHARFQATRAELKESTTPEEWSELEKASTKAMAALATRLGSI